MLKAPSAKTSGHCSYSFSKRSKVHADLAVPQSFFDLGIEVVPSPHLPDIHPAGVAKSLQVVTQGPHLVLGLPLVAQEHLWHWILALCNITNIN